MDSDNSSSDENDNQDFEENENQESDEDEVTLSQREVIRKEVSSMSFEDLQKLKERIGSKAYDKVVFGSGTQAKKSPARSFKRANKNRPREMSSKKRVNPKDLLEKVRKPAPRDPRFDPLCGTFDDKTFKSNYTFIKDVRKKERVQLEKEYNDESDPKRKQKIKLLMQRMDNQIREQEKLEKQKRERDEEKQNIRGKLKQGEKPVFKKKSEKRIEGLINKYEELKKTNKLQKHFERRYKKLASKDRKTYDTTPT